MTANHTTGPYIIVESGPALRYTVQSAEGEPLAMTYGQARQHADAVLFAEAPAMLEALRGLMAIAELAMPDTYFQTDSRVCAARAILHRLDNPRP